MAAERLGWESINARVLEGLDALDAEEVELRENLDRGDLSPAEMSMHSARLKEIRGEKHRLKPIPKDPANQHTSRSSPQVEGKSKDKKANTAKVVAKETGRSAASIERDAHRAKYIPKLEEVVGTSLDKGVELDALAKMPVEKQEEVIARAVAGEKVSAKTELKKVERAEKEQRLAAKQTALPDRVFGHVDQQAAPVAHF